MALYVDKRDNSKVIVVREGRDMAIVKRLRDGRRYLVGKSDLREIRLKTRS